MEQTPNGLHATGTKVSQGFFDHRIAARIPPSVLPDPNSASLGRDKLRELYYYYFHEAHPIMFPQAFLARVPAHGIPAVVEMIIDYVGAQYSVKARAEAKYLHNLQACLYAKDTKRDAYMVQALTLLGIVYRAQDQNDMALSTFAQATDLALQLGMHRASFSRLNCGGEIVVQEMWRRVWWELYVNELMLAAFRHDVYSRMNTIEVDVELPWEENEYRTCQVSFPLETNKPAHCASRASRVRSQSTISTLILTTMMPRFHPFPTGLLQLGPLVVSLLSTSHFAPKARI